MVSYVIKCEFLEDQVEKDVSNYLGLISRLWGPRLRLLQVDEQLTGADALFNWRARAFYLQFKVPIGLESTTTTPLPKTPRLNESKLQDIRRFRADQSLVDSPHSLCFQLRRMAKTATELQHNILFRHEQPPHSRAAYVCPTALTKNEYEWAMTPNLLYRLLDTPFQFQSARINVFGAIQSIQESPMLRGHAVIVPHSAVTDFNHYYSFSQVGSSVAFHSQPTVVRSEALRLSDFISASLIDWLDSGPEGFLPYKVLAKEIRAAARAVGDDKQTEQMDDENPQAWLGRYGRELQWQYGIRQIIALFRDGEDGARFSY